MKISLKNFARFYQKIDFIFTVLLYCCLVRRRVLYDYQT
jgi:hypothetical protein